MAEAKRDGNFKVTLIAWDPIAETPKNVTVESLTNAEALHVAMVDGSGDQITSFGGGTEYTDGGTPPANPVGKAIVFENSGAWASVTETIGLPVNIVGGSSSGTQYTEADTDASITGTAIMWEDSADTLRSVSAAKPLPVDLGANNDVTVTSGTIDVIGTVADDATTPGDPVMIGGTAKSPDGTSPGNVSAEDDVSRIITDLNRRLFVNTVSPRQLHKHLNGSTAYTDESIAAAPGAGFQIVITNIIGSTGAATALNFFLEEGSTTIFGPIYLEAVAGRGFASGPIYLPVTANTAVTLTSSASIAQSFDIDYFIQKV